MTALKEEIVDRGCIHDWLPLLSFFRGFTDAETCAPHMDRRDMGIAELLCAGPVMTKDNSPVADFHLRTWRGTIRRSGNE